MEDVLERRQSLDPEAFARPPEVAALSREVFTLDELAEAYRSLPFPLPKSTVTNVVSRIKIPLVAEPPGGTRGRQFRSLDAYAIGLFVALDREIERRADHKVAARAALRTEIQHLLWGGDAMTPAEAAARTAEFRAKRTAALRKGGKAARANDEFLFKLHEQRRRELGGNIFAAPPLVWSRDPDRHFVVLLRKDVTLSFCLIDRNGPARGHLDARPLFEAGFAHMIDVTSAFGLVDAALARVVADRDGLELVGAD